MCGSHMRTSAAACSSWFLSGVWPAGCGVLADIFPESRLARPSFLALSFSHPCVCMQTRKSQAARSATSEEFIQSVMCDAEKGAHDLGIEHPIYAFDNASIHNAAKATMPHSALLPIPAWSPDFMKAIEHNHQYVCDKFEKLVMSVGDQKKTSEWFRSKLESTFYEQSTPARVGADIKSLKQTYQGIIAARGGYGPKSQR